ncbi:hypothetical protein Tco_1486992, partial [Tanacetum coccineum]
MVAYLEKSEKNAKFHQIVHFLSTCSINYALTAVVISESSVRNYLLFNDEDGITCLTNEDIFENLALIGYEQLSTKLTFQKGKVTPLFESMLVQNQAPECESSVTPPEPQPTPSTSQPNVSEPQTVILQTETPPTISHEPQTEANIEQILPPSIYQRKHRKTQKHRRSKKVTELPQTRPERVLKQPNEPPLPKGGYTPGSDEGRLKLEELMAVCRNLSKYVLDLEKEKDSQAVEILKLKKRKKLERQRKSSISHPRRGIYRQIESFDDDLDEEDASKQGRKSDKTKPMFKDSDFDGLDDDMENVEGEIVYAATFRVSTAGALVSTARPTVSTAGPSTSDAGTSTGILEDEMVTMVDTLIAIRRTRTRPSYVRRPTLVVITNTEQEQRRLTTPPPS